MHSATSKAPSDGPASPSSPPPTINSTPSKRRHRADSNPHSRWSPSSAPPEPKRVRSDSGHASSSFSSSSHVAPSLNKPILTITPPSSLPSLPQPHIPSKMLSAKSQGKLREVVVDPNGGPPNIYSPGPGTYTAYHTASGGSLGGASSNSNNICKRPSAFQPHAGARKLVIKNLRTTPPARAASVEEYYTRTWDDLDEALTTIFSGRKLRQPLERLYRGVEDLCRRGEAEKLAELLRTKFDDHLVKDVLAHIRRDGGGGDGGSGGVGEAGEVGEAGGGTSGNNVTMLRAVLAHWKIWSTQLTLIRSIFSYLDRSFLINTKSHAQINDMGISQFRKMAFPQRKDAGSQAPSAQVIAGMIELVEYDRRGDERFDPPLLKESVSMLRIFNVYGKLFESRFLKGSRAYFEEFAEERSTTCSLKDYIATCEKLLKREDYRCIQYNFDGTTKRQLLDSAHEILIEKYSAKLLDSGSVGKLLDDHEVESVKALYELLRLSGIQKRLKQPWEEYIRQAGAVIVADTSRGEEMVVRLLELRRGLDIMIRDAFAKDEDFNYGLREAFGNFINDKKIASAWNTGTSKVGEMIAKYIDMLLRGGLKTLPKTLLSDSKDRAAAEQSGLASTADEDAELDRQLDHGLELFRFIEGKDVFEAFYKKDLARRLLMGRSASQDAERNMLTKLKSECGSSFTHNLEQMFKDQELAKDEMASYKMWKEGNGHGAAGLDLNVSILSAAAWPTYTDVKVLLPPEVLEHIEPFDRYYRHKHTGRRLTWKHNLAHCMVKARFNRGPKELLVSAFQAVVLVLFNQAEDDGSPLSYEQISQSTGLSGGDLQRTLQSLACGKARVLQKHPKGKEVNATDTFTVNKGFWDPKYRVKINQIQLRETKEENKETHQRVAADRQFETQAAIVRIMKSRKTMTHSQLVAEVINQTKSRGAVDAGEIKKNIEKLIEKDYLDREGGSYTYLA